LVLFTGVGFEDTFAGADFFTSTAFGADFEATDDLASLPDFIAVFLTGSALALLAVGVGFAAFFTGTADFDAGLAAVAFDGADCFLAESAFLVGAAAFFGVAFLVAIMT
jgi:hypothetical protein